MTLIGAGSLVRKYRQDIAEFSRGGRGFVESQLGPLNCAERCAYCCYAKIIVSLGEGTAIYLYLKSSGLWSNELEERLREADRLMTPVPHGEWMGLHKPCVFLKETTFGEGTCQVYPVRPLGCAATYSNLDPQTCAEPAGQHVTFVNFQALKHFAELDVAMYTVMGVTGRPNMTIAGAVLTAHALCENLPRPDVHAIDGVAIALAQKTRGTVAAAQLYDETARKRAT